MDLEKMKSLELLDIAAKINVMQKGFCDFCRCVFSEFDDIDIKYGVEDEVPIVEDMDCTIANPYYDANSRIENLDKRIAIRRSCMSISNKFRLNIKDEVEKLTGLKLIIDQADTVYDSVMTSNMSKIVEDIVSMVQKRDQKEGTQK